MLSFIRKRLPSKDRTNEHLQNIKSNHIKDQHQHQDDNDEMKRSQSSKELNNNNNNDDENKKKKKKKKTKTKTKDKCSSTIFFDSNVDQINKSYSDVDYFPMMPSNVSQSVNHDKTSTNRDSLVDSYLNLRESLQPTTDLQYVQTAVIKPRLFQIPVIDSRKEKEKGYKDVDHQRTKALREVTEERTQQRFVK